LELCLRSLFQSRFIALLRSFLGVSRRYRGLQLTSSNRGYPCSRQSPTVCIEEMTVPRGENENRGLYGWKRRSSTGRGSAMPAITLTPLLGGLDLSNDADVLGLKTSPEELEDAVVEALEAGAPRRDRATAPRSLTPRSPPPLLWPGGGQRVEGRAPEADLSPQYRTIRAALARSF
jgi:hypothetical protein